MRREDVCLAFVLLHVTVPRVGDLLIIEMRTVIDKKSISKRTSYEGIGVLLGAASETLINEKSIDEEISHEEIDNWDK